MRVKVASLGSMALIFLLLMEQFDAKPNGEGRDATLARRFDTLHARQSDRSVLAIALADSKSQISSFKTTSKSPIWAGSYKSSSRGKGKGGKGASMMIMGGKSVKGKGGKLMGKSKSSPPIKSPKASNKKSSKLSPAPSKKHTKSKKGHVPIGPSAAPTTRKPTFTASPLSTQYPSQLLPNTPTSKFVHWQRDIHITLFHSID